METIQKKEKKRQDCAEIVEKIRSGQATQEEYAKIYQRVIATCRLAVLKKSYSINSYELKTRCHDIATALLGKLDRYIPDPKFTFEGYVYRSACNAIIDFYRRNTKFRNDVPIEQENEYQSSDELKEEEPDPSKVMEQKDLVSLIGKAVPMLTKQDQLLFVAHYKEGQSAEQIANRLSVSREAVYLRWHRVLQRLKAEILRMGYKPSDLF